jgi:hypothetical protein
MRPVFLEKSHSCVVIVGNTASFIFRASPASKWGKVPQVAAVDSVVRLVVLGELEQLPPRLFVN